MKLVLYPPVDAERLEKLRAAAPELRLANCGSAEEARAEIADAEGFFGKITPELLAAAAKLRWVQSPTASLEHYLFPALIEHPCTLTNMRGLFSDVIADQVFGYILCFARNLHTYIRRQMRAEWRPVGGETERPDFSTGPGTVNGLDRAHLHLADCTLGVVGCGSIGGEVCRRGLAFGMTVRAVDPVRTEPPAPGVRIGRMEELDGMLAASHFVVIAAPHTPETGRMFDAARIARMRRDGYLINIGRGAIVVLDDLVEALESGAIAGAALDVFEVEPLPADHKLWRMENAILTPHIAGYSPRIAGRHLSVLLENVRRFARGEPLINVADKARWF